MFIFSIFLVFIAALTIVVSYYNLFLAYRNRPPFKVFLFCPQVLFPRGKRGLGKHNMEDENSTTPKDDYKNMAKSYKPLAA